MEYTILNMLAFWGMFCIVQLSSCEETSDPVRVLAMLGSTTFLPCGTTVADPYKVTWSKNNVAVLENTDSVLTFANNFSSSAYAYITANFSISVLRVDVSDDVFYDCAVLETRWSQQVKHYSRPAVYKPPTTVNILPVMLDTVENASVDLTCDVPMVYPNGTLQIHINFGLTRVCDASVNYTNNTNGTKRAQARCTVQFNRAANGKHVQCVAEYQFEDVRPEAVLSSRVPVTVRFPPSNTMIENLSLAMRENNSLNFRCTTDVLNPKSSLTNMLWEIDSTLQNNATSLAFTNASSGYGGYTASSIVTFPALRTYNLKSLTCTPEWENHTISAQSSVTLTVYYLPEINLNISGQLNENSTCALTCSLNGGNPSNTAEYTFSWFWRANHEQLETNLRHSQQSLPFNPVTRHQSGLYRCEASSVASGTARGETWLNINYAPVGVNVQGNNKTIYASYNTSTQLHLTVHSFPAEEHTNFTWTKNTSSVASHKEILGNNQTRSTVNISSVSEADYGYYTVEVTNGADRRSVFYVELKLQGKPTPAFEINPLSISYRQIVLSFRPGMDGGLSQTLKVEYKKVNTSSSLNTENVENPVHGVQQNFTIAREIEPSTEYEIVITSDNSFDGQPTGSTPLQVTTKAKPIVKVKDLSIVVTGDEFTLRWPEVALGAGDSLYVQQCGVGCLTRDVSGMTEGVFQRNNGTSFKLLHYQGSDLVLELEFEKDTEPPTPISRPVGVVVGVVIVVAVVAVVATIIAVLFFKRRNNTTAKDDPKVKTALTNIQEENGDNDNAALMYGPPKKIKKQMKSGSNAQRPEENPALAIFAEVAKSKKTAKLPLDGNGAAVEHAQVDSTKKTQKPQARSTNHEGGNFEMKPVNGNVPDFAVYGKMGNVDTTCNTTVNENPYSNNQAMCEPYANVEFDTSSSPNAAQDESGLVYADISFAGSNTTQDARGKPVILGSEDRVEYAVVDFNARADPLPPSDGEEDSRRSLHDQD